MEDWKWNLGLVLGPLSSSVFRGTPLLPWSDVSDRSGLKLRTSLEGGSGGCPCKRPKS